MADNNINNKQPFHAADDAVLQVATILAEMADPNNLQQQLDVERAKNKALEVRKYAVEMMLEATTGLLGQRILDLQAEMQRVNEDHERVLLEGEVIEEENENLQERLNAATNGNYDLRQWSTQDSQEIFRLRQENQRLQNSIINRPTERQHNEQVQRTQKLQLQFTIQQADIKDLERRNTDRNDNIKELEQARQDDAREMEELRRQLAARDHEPTKEDVEDENSEIDVKMEDHEENEA